MNDLVKYIVIGIVGYFGYKYYKENISADGKTKKVALEKQKNENFQVKIDQLKEQFKSNGFAICSSITLSPLSVQNQVQGSCRNSVMTQMDTIDWVAMARDNAPIEEAASYQMV